MDNNNILEKGERYTLYDLHTNEKEDALIRSHSFDTIQTKDRRDSTKEFFIMGPDGVRSSESYPLVSLSNMREKMMKLLQEKEMLLPSVDMEEKEGSIRSLIDELLKDFFW